VCEGLSRPKVYYLESVVESDRCAGVGASTLAAMDIHRGCDKSERTPRHSLCCAEWADVLCTQGCFVRCAACVAGLAQPTCWSHSNLRHMCVCLELVALSCVLLAPAAGPCVAACCHASQWLAAVQLMKVCIWLGCPIHCNQSCCVGTECVLPSLKNRVPTKRQVRYSNICWSADGFHLSCSCRS
jgi:hypothetical protein